MEEIHENDELLENKGDRAAERGDIGAAGADIISVPSDALKEAEQTESISVNTEAELIAPAVDLLKQIGQTESISVNTEAESVTPAVDLSKQIGQTESISVNTEAEPIAPAVDLSKQIGQTEGISVNTEAESTVPTADLSKHTGQEEENKNSPAYESTADNTTDNEDEKIIEKTDMSLEGRHAQLEEKVRAVSAPPQGQPAGSYVFAPTGAQPMTAGVPQVQVQSKSARGAKSYIIMIAAITVIFLVGFIWECSRTYRDTGIFGGDLDRFVDTDYDPFGMFGGRDDDEDDSDKGSHGLFPFTLPDSDDEDEEPFLIPDSDASDIDGSDLDSFAIKKAPDADSIVDPSAAVLKLHDQPDDIDTGEYTARYAYRQVKDSVVNVVIYSNPDVVGQTPFKLGTGTGIVISSNGYVITNSHVIEDKKGVGVEIILTNGKSYAAAIVGYDTRTDLAVLKIDATGLSAAEFVDSAQIEVGQDAIAVGNPGGVEYSNSLTRGCVSALNRTVKSNTVVSYIQTDAAINPGNSGGPLLNSAGQVMGVTTIKIASTDYEGMGFAIPSDTVVEIVNDIISKGFVSGRVRLGITGKVYEGGILTETYGIEIIEMESDSPLKGTEVRTGDVITSINGVETPDFSSLFLQLAQYNPDDEVTLGMYRPPSAGDAGKTYEIKVKLVADEGATQHD